MVLYETRLVRIRVAKILRVQLRNLAGSYVTGHSTLLVAPVGGEDEFDLDLFERLASG